MSDEGPDARDAEVDADGRALASVVRLRILRLCLDDALTNKEIAARLGKDPATTFHHVQVLADRGFLAAQPERRGARGAREVPYLATRKSWRTPLPEGQSRVLVEAFLEELAEADPRTVTSGRMGLRLTDEHHAELVSRVNALLDEYAAMPPDPDGRPWSVFVAVHEDVARRDLPGPSSRPSA